MPTLNPSDVNNIIESKFIGEPVSSFSEAVLDPEGHKLTLLFDKLRLTFQAIDSHDHSSMEVVLQRCIKEKPNFVMIPLAPLAGTTDNILRT